MDTIPFPLHLLPGPVHTYTGIGSRKAPADILLLMQGIGTALAQRGLTLRSGAAKGADAAFEAGCDAAHGTKEIFLPWKEFNDHPSHWFTPPAEAELIASLCHPCWKRCSSSSRRFHARNVQQVFGPYLNDPVQFLIFWAVENEGTVTGGTATAVHLARKADIPTFNLYHEVARQMFAAFVATQAEQSPQRP